MKLISLDYKECSSKILLPNTIEPMEKVVCENENYKEGYTRTRLSTNSSKLSIASLIIDKHSSKVCSLVKYIGFP